MTVIEKKAKLIEKINNTDDAKLLDYLSDIIEFEWPEGGFHEMSAGEIEAVEEGLKQLDNGQWITNEEANIYKLSPEEKAAIKEGIEQIDSGQYYSNEEARKIFDKCLGK